MFFRRHRTPPAATKACARLAACATLDELVATISATARAVTGADGITVVQRDHSEVHYLTEDAIAPLWTGQSFPLRMCVTGQAMLSAQPIVIPDIMRDNRVPLNAYLGTFVRRLVIVPIGTDAPQLAMGAYWRAPQPIAADTLVLLGDLAASAADALASIDASGAKHAA